MDELWAEIEAFFSVARLLDFAKVVVILVVGWTIARLLSRAAARVAARRGGAHQKQLVSRAVRYVILTVTLLAAISELGVDLSVLLGAAGILTVAVGFASQSSAANVISGAFLLGEKAFEVGDTIVVGPTTGEVLSIDLLSVKLRTFDNLFVRIPNELLLKTEIRNLSRFPIRRLDMPLTIAYAEDFERVRAVLRRVAADNIHCLDEPRPVIVFTGFGDFGFTVQYSVWVSRERFLEVRGVLHAEVVAALAEAGVRLPTPRQGLYPAPDAEPFAIRLVQDPAAPTAPAPGAPEGAS